MKIVNAVCDEVGGSLKSAKSMYEVLSPERKILCNSSVCCIAVMMLNSNPFLLSIYVSFAEDALRFIYPIFNNLYEGGYNHVLSFNNIHLKPALINLTSIALYYATYDTICQLVGSVIGNYQISSFLASFTFYFMPSMIEGMVSFVQKQIGSNTNQKRSKRLLKVSGAIELGIFYVVNDISLTIMVALVYNELKDLYGHSSYSNNYSNDYSNNRNNRNNRGDGKTLFTKLYQKYQDPALQFAFLHILLFATAYAALIALSPYCVSTAHNLIVPTLVANLTTFYITAEIIKQIKGNEVHEYYCNSKIIIPLVPLVLYMNYACGSLISLRSIFTVCAIFQCDDILSELTQYNYHREIACYQPLSDMLKLSILSVLVAYGDQAILPYISPFSDYIITVTSGALMVGAMVLSNDVCDNIVKSSTQSILNFVRGNNESMKK